MSSLFDFLPSEGEDWTHALMPCMAPACTMQIDLEEWDRRLAQKLPAYIAIDYTKVTCPDCLNRWGGLDGLHEEARRQQGRQASARQ